MQEDFNFNFDKFVDDIARREPAAPVPQSNEDIVTPQREYIKRYRELPQNRIVWDR